jgi:pimeloyl-ACP methyl ester carboxylesterase
MGTMMKVRSGTGLKRGSGGTQKPGSRSRRCACSMALGLFLIAGLGRSTCAQQPVTVSDLGLPGDSVERVLYLSAAPSSATVVLLPGGNGVISIDSTGGVAPGGNFLVRTRALWVAQGFNVVLPAPPDGQSLMGRRSRPEYAAALDRVIDFARSRGSVPVWVIGTSQGSVAAANAAAHASGKLAGVVLTSSVTEWSGSGETSFDTNPALIQIPALVVANTSDTCRASPPADAQRLLATMVRSPHKDLLMVDSRQIRSDPCEAMSPHGYLGIEAMVVQRVADWIKGTPGH